tara:strand:- start:175 stop:408 length:234 start_codon:yes stop_codon:yes gene_type:complete
MSSYDKHVEAVGKLILKGVWFSDAIEIVHVVLGPRPHIEWGIAADDRTEEERFEDDVNEYVDKSGEYVHTPHYKNIF